MNPTTSYDCAVIGGGLAGLALSVQLARKGARVILFEKGHYPFHKVCGEYLSLESAGFLQELGVPFEEWQLPVMKQLVLSAPGGARIRSPLPMGGMGVSRYRLDSSLAAIAARSGVEIREQTRVTHVEWCSAFFRILTNKGAFGARVCCDASGRYSHPDVPSNPDRSPRRPGSLHKLIAVKYHVRLDEPKDTISLHLFDGGYCGLSAIEEDKFCLCYLSRAANLRHSGNKIGEMEKEVLGRNPALKKIFSSAEFLFSAPLTISGISLRPKEQVRDHVLMAGDAAGMIAPLCGNGMSMALHASRIAGRLILDFLAQEIDRVQLETEYAARWSAAFRHRLRAGRLIQWGFDKRWISGPFIHALRPFPAIMDQIISRTHGKPF